jgi:hypothetical protein
MGGLWTDRSYPAIVPSSGPGLQQTRTKVRPRYPQIASFWTTEQRGRFRTATVGRPFGILRAASFVRGHPDRFRVQGMPPAGVSRVDAPLSWATRPMFEHRRARRVERPRRPGAGSAVDASITCSASRGSDEAEAPASCRFVAPERGAIAGQPAGLAFSRAMLSARSRASFARGRHELSLLRPSAPPPRRCGERHNGGTRRR